MQCKLICDILQCLQGRFKYQPNEVKAFGMIAGGTGITPMFQVLDK
jgi:ferredoxin-NADP reductase